MAIRTLDQTGVSEAAEELSAGRAVVLPCSSPLPYAVAGSSAAAVNTAKGRPAAQPVGMAVADPAELRPFTTLDHPTWELAGWVSRIRKVNLLLPVTDTVPGWAAPAVSDGFMAVTFAWMPELRTLLTRFGHLCLSSANRTTRKVATTAPTANTEFGDELLVLDGDPLRDTTGSSGSAAIIRVRSGFALDVFRDGINTEGWSDHGSYLTDLIRDWRADRVS